MNTSSPQFDPSPAARLERWIDQLFKRGITQCVAESGDDLESLVVELRSAGEVRAIARRVKRIKELIPVDQRASTLKLSCGGLGSSSNHKSGWNMGGGAGAGWGGYSCWGGTPQTYRSPQADISDRALQLESSYESSRYKVMQRRRSEGGDWIDELLGELSALVMLIELTRELDRLTPDARSQHLQRLGRAAHRVERRAGAQRQGELICLGVSERPVRRYQRQRVWYLDPSSGELLYAQRAPKHNTAQPSITHRDEDLIDLTAGASSLDALTVDTSTVDTSTVDTSTLDTSASLYAQGSISRVSYRVIHGLSPRQVSFTSDTSKSEDVASQEPPVALATSARSSAHTSTHFNRVRWCDHFDAALDEWRALLALDPFATRPLIAIRAVRAAARWIGDLANRTFTDQAEVHLDSSLEPQLPSINLYLIDEHGLSTRVYASALDRWRMARLSAETPIRAIAEWSGDGLKPLLWCADRDESKVQWSTPRSRYNHRLTGLSKTQLREAPTPSISMERLSAERAERSELYTAYRERAERGVLSELGIRPLDDQEAQAELSGALVAELRRDLAALWLWSRADLPLTSPPPTYTYEELLEVSAPTLRAIKDADELDPPRGHDLPF